MSLPPLDSNVARLDPTARGLAAMSESRHAEAALACREVAEQEQDPETAAAWLDAAAVLERLAHGKPVAAFMFGYTRALPEPLRGALVERLANELELAGQPLLAMAAYDWLGPSSFVTAERSRLARELDPRLAEDEPERRRLVAERILEHFRDAAAARDVLALRASARALVELGQPREALARVRQALECEPEHFATRLSEADLLGQIGERDARRALLLELARSEPQCAAAARKLAEDFGERVETEPGALAEATYWYAEALARRYDEAVVLDFAKMLVRANRIDEAIAQLELGHERTLDPLWKEDFARELAKLQRERGQLEQARRWREEVERRVGIRERGYAIAAIALMVVLFAVLIVFAVLVD